MPHGLPRSHSIETLASTRLSSKAKSASSESLWSGRLWTAFFCLKKSLANFIFSMLICPFAVLRISPGPCDYELLSHWGTPPALTLSEWRLSGTKQQSPSVTLLSSSESTVLKPDLRAFETMLNSKTRGSHQQYVGEEENSKMLYKTRVLPFVWMSR